MSILYSTCSTPRSMSQLSASAFDEKASELDKLKKICVLHMKQVNALKLEYMEWWNRKRSSFLNALRSVQALHRYMCPQEVHCMSDFNKVIQMAEIYQRAGKLHVPPQSLELLLALQTFWNRYTELTHQCEETVVSPVNDYCESITRLQDEAVKARVDKLAYDVTIKSQPDYDFTSIHDDRENLFVYKLSVNEKELLGFVGFIPHLINLQRKLCYWVTKLAVEKE